ncbi:MAG: hypothetical protein R3C19_15335 [Planctomycetaceae bacterium]
MSEPARGSDHDARIAALRGFQRSITSGVDAGLAQLGPLNDPVRVFAALQLLIQNDRFQDAVDLVATRRLDCKWVEQAVYAYVALKDLASPEGYSRSPLRNVMKSGCQIVVGCSSQKRRSLRF